MAAVALNKFLTIRHKATTDYVGIYTCPTGVASVILTCQATNVSTGAGASTYNISGIHSRTDGGFNFAYEFDIPENDGSNLLGDGKLALETSDILMFKSNVADKIDIILSVLETAKS